MAAMTRSRLPQTLRVREKTARAGLARRKADRRRHAAIEELERRLVMSAVSWTGLGDGTTWQDLNNWSTKAVPGGSDDVTINVANNPPIIYNGTSSIHSLVDNDSLNIAGGSLTVTSGLTVGSGATLSATNAGTSFTASGATTIDGANLYASGGATLSLPAATSYTQNTGSWNSNRTLQASGAGSVLALPNLTTITGSTQYGSNLYVQALAGGHVNLGAATAVTGGAVNLTADGTNSVLDLSALQSFQGYFEYQYYTSTSNIQATNGGSILDPQLATVNTAGLTLDGTGTIGTASITALTNSTVAVSGTGTAADFSGVTDLSSTSLTLSGGGTANLDHAAKIDGANISVSGGVTLTLPAATSYTQNTGSWNSNRTLQASGAGSVLALPNLTTITGSTQYGSNLYVQALAGGHVNLGAATAVTGGAVNLTADGTNSVLDLSALQSFQGYFEYQYYTSTSNIQATNGGSILDPRLATVNTAGLTLDGTGTIGTASITALTNSTVAVSGTGTAADFSGVTDLSSTSLTLSGGGTANLDHAAKIDGANISVSGGVTLTLPAATSYTQNTGSWNSNRTLQASGAGSVLALPNLTTITGSTQYGSNLYVQALAGGHVNLSAATAVTGGAVNLTADGSNSVLDLSALQSFQGYFINFQIYTSTSNIRATNGGSILDPRLATVNTAGLTLDGTGTIGTASITALTNSTVTVSGTGTAADFSGVTDLSSTSLTLSGGGTANLDHAAKIDGANIAVSGGVTLTLPAATSYTQNTGSWN